MSETIVFEAQVRKETGSKHTAILRKAGRIPAVVYGHGQEPVSISLNTHEFVEGLHHGHRVFDIEIDGKKVTLLIKDLQYDHLGKNVIHTDLVRVDLSEKVKVTVPIKLRGTAKGAAEGGIIDEILAQLEVECAVTDIPKSISINIKEIEIGDVIHAGEVELPSGASLVTATDAVVLTCHIVAAAKSTEELEEDMPTAPEVITEREKEEEDSED